MSLESLEVWCYSIKFLMEPVIHLQRHQLIRHGVPTLFIAVALDEGPGPPLRSPYTDLTKLYAVVSVLIRCCDVSLQQKSLAQVSGTYVPLAGKCILIVTTPMGFYLEILGGKHAVGVE